MAQNITLLGANYQAVPAVKLPKTGGGTATFTDVSDTTSTASDVAVGTYFYTAAGVRTQGTNSGGGGGGKNIQVYAGYDETNATSYTATDLSIKVAKAGTYKISWTGSRNTTSGTSGSQIYVNGTAKGSAHTSFTRNYFQFCQETLTLAANDTVVVRARARSNTYYMQVGNLIIEEQ